MYLKMISRSASLSPTAIESLPDNLMRPKWSVMIPTYNGNSHLELGLKSVLKQDPGPDEMQIEVVDDASTIEDPGDVINAHGQGRVSLFRKSINGGSVKNFNTCIERSRGELVHILHGDDVVLPGYYRTILEMTHRYPAAGLYATRCFYVDEKSIVLGVTDRIVELESGGNGIARFFATTPIQFAGTTVRRAVYEELGGFVEGLSHTADCEMWARIVAARGGVVSHDVLAEYRIYSNNDSSRLTRSAENVRDLARLNELFSERYTSFNARKAERRVSDMAWSQYQRFRMYGDVQSAHANKAAWREFTPPVRRFAKRLRQIVGQLFSE